MAKDKKANTAGYYNPADFINRPQNGWEEGSNAAKFEQMLNDTPNQESMPADYLAQRRPSSDPTGNIAASMDNVSSAPVASPAPQDMTPQGKQVGNTNTDVANAQPGDWIIRSNGAKIVLNQADIDWAKGKLAQSKATVSTKTAAPVTSTAKPDVKNEEQMTMMTGGRFTGDEKAREAYAPKSKALQPETPKQVNNAAKDIAKAKVGDWIIRSNGTKVMLSQADIDWAKGKIKDADPNGTAKKRTNTVKQGQADAKAAMEAAGYKNR